MKSFIAGAGLLGLVATAPNPAPGYGGSPKVTVKNGTIEGLHSATYNEDYFLGIPFAQPPVEDLRFRNPRSINTSFDGVLQAIEYAPACYGYGGDQIGYPQSDDCLYLNIVRPSGYENASLPIGVWIHGGGLYQGSTRDERYNLSFIVENSVKIGKPIIGASIAYRLGPWGFLQSQEVSASGNTNIGLRDQRLALHWINENIAAFGGDPKKVTIWGESAGAGSVGWHLTAYNGRDDGIFRAGIMESGNPVNYNSYKTNIDYQPRFNDLLNRTNCTTSLDRLDCLRKVPVQTIQNIFNSTSLQSGWSPIVDGDFIQRWGSIQLQEGAFVKVPIIDGANSDEGNSFAPQPVSSEEDFASFIANTSLSNPLPEWWVAETLKAYPNEPAYWVPSVAELGNYTYPESYGAQYRRASAYFGDVYFHANRRGAVETWAAHDLHAYSYRFNTRPAGYEWNQGVMHFVEVAFVFDNTQGLGYDEEHGTVNPFLDKPKSYYDLADLMSKSWTSFIHDLDPNYAGKNASSPAWPRYDLKNRQNIVFDANVTGVACGEPDTYREKGIRFILDHSLAYRR
ncbi:hypothetical protein M409DRAFT_68850 [Zasmidium cellare ATCC 36951]|uniref:Carboxylic ester hydrolase n=1 Tax=Zasmidium cellare ATCC 36951 TaxID=1080233 RepID=A0A6A6C9E1_ZASCE|nr:uncharacterized protein M409DRAFT_68850 [Zasmidium cellare ATCC 36951]KAF2162880.1 hypothetical protein M409DRAFT_68850 [Zasmidium cellare ATCC 36951]